MSTLTAQVPGAECEGLKMHKFQSAKLPIELLIDIADQVSAPNSLWMKSS